MPFVFEGRFEVGEQIRQERQLRGMTQQQLATELGVSLRTISNWETGYRDPRPASVRKVHELFVRMDTLDGKGEGA